MTVETGTTLSDLDEAWPLAGDPHTEGDNHIRLIKAILKDQFPGALGNGFAIPITATEAELNSLSGIASNVQAQINSLNSLKYDKTGGPITGNATISGSLGVGTTLSVTGAVTLLSTLLLAADPTLALQAATKQYVDASVQKGFLFGLNTAYVSSTSASIGVGSAKSEDNTQMMVLASPITKIITNPWVAGTGLGGYAGGALVDGWYNYFLLAKPDGTVDAGFDSSATASNLLGAGPAGVAGYTTYRRVAYVKVSGSTIVRYIQNGDEFAWYTPRHDVVDNIPLATRVSHTTSVPPSVKGRFTVNYRTAATNLGNLYAVVTELNAADVAPSTSRWDLVVGQWSVDYLIYSSLELQRFVNGSSQIGFRSTGTDPNTFMNIITQGWADTRGKIS